MHLNVHNCYGEWREAPLCVRKKKGAYYSGIKIFNNLPLEIKNIDGNKKKI